MSGSTNHILITKSLTTYISMNHCQRDFHNLKQTDGSPIIIRCFEKINLRNYLENLASKVGFMLQYDTVPEEPIEIALNES